jgi:hypothetical protein
VPAKEPLEIGDHEPVFPSGSWLLEGLFRLRALTDESGVSFRDSVSSSAGHTQVFRRGDKICAIDTRRLPLGSVIRDGVPAGHVTVRATPAQIRAAVVDVQRHGIPASSTRRPRSRPTHSRQRGGSGVISNIDGVIHVFASTIDTQVADIHASGEGVRVPAAPPLTGSELGRNSEREAGSARDVVAREIAVMLLGDAASDGEAEAVAGLAGVESREAFEDPSAFVLRHAGAVVGDLGFDVSVESS